MSDTTDAKSIPDPKEAREKAKQIAEARRAELRNKKRKCALCGLEESDKTPFFAHPDGIGPTCREPTLCEHYRQGPRFR
ncbi:MAG: hypothetical protein K1X89_10085 [Myxococcaceae bacterium]|nr:hypothetical protein [Myxococcaceae bacterium]